VSPDRATWLRLRRAVNLANGSTLAGLAVAALGCTATTRSADGLFVGVGYRLPLPPAPAFCLGNVIMTRGDGIDPGSALFRHEARHATQFACCGGLAMIPLYLAAAGVSWALTGDFGARNLFERRAGLADGGYTDKPLRIGKTRPAAGQRARPPSTRSGAVLSRVRLSRTCRIDRQPFPVSRNSPSAGSAAIPFMMACGSPMCRSPALRALTTSVTSPLSGSMPAR
jgi:hypothetical protein